MNLYEYNYTSLTSREKKIKINRSILKHANTTGVYIYTPMKIVIIMNYY